MPIRALTFDCYGTLIDWERGILAVLAPWAPELEADTLLAHFAALETAVQQAAPRLLYRDVLAEVGRRLSLHLRGAADESLAQALSRSVPQWPAFPDTPSAMARLAERAALVVVSNVDHDSFAGSRPRLGAELAALITAQDVGAYKPDPRPLQRAIDLLAARGITRGEILHVAQSLYHDHVPAKALGLRTVFINRRKGRPGWGATPPPAAPVTPDFEFASLADFAAALSTGTVT